MDMTMANCREFVTVLASDAPAPGGGMPPGFPVIILIRTGR